MGADPGGIAAAALTVCAAAIPDRIKLQVKQYDEGWTESARLWVALIGSPSTKKSPILSAAAKPLIRQDRLLWREYASQMSEYARLSADERKSSEPPKQRRLRIEDTTIEAAQEVLKDSPDGPLCLQDELSGWFGSMDKYAGNRGAAKDRGFWLQSFNGGPYAINRIGRGPGMIDNLSICMLGGIQPDPVRKLAAESVDDGLLQRIFPIVLRPAVLGRDEPAPDIGRRYEALVYRLIALEPPRQGGIRDPANARCDVLRFDEGAHTVRRELEPKHLDLMATETVNRKLAAHFGKYDGLFARLCVVWHCIENAGTDRLPKIVGQDTAQRVAAFLHQFLLPHAVAFHAGVLGLSDDHDRLIAVAAYILAHKLETVTGRDVQRGDRTMRAMDRQETQSILEKLEAFGWLEQVPMPRNGTAPRWTVRPSVHQMFEERGMREARRRDHARRIIADLAVATSGAG